MRLVRVVVVVVAMVIGVPAASAQHSLRPIRLIVGVPPGGAPDIVARMAKLKSAVGIERCAALAAFAALSPFDR